LKLRGYREEDRGAVARVTATALGGSVEYWEEEYYEPEKNPRLDPDQVYVVEEDGGIRATAAVLPFEVFYEGRTVSMGGMAAVATHPAYRRRGYAGELIQAALSGMRERNVHLSMLHPFAHSYYRRYGWELATEAISYDLKPTDLPTSHEQKRVRAYRDKDLPRMMRLLEGEASRRGAGGCCLRRGGSH
jgi:GNAT superfamily N-acetyltransferase